MDSFPSNPTTGLLTRRHEVKYLVDEDTAARVRSFIEPFTGVDPYMGLGAGKGYEITSLYLDSPSHTLYRATRDNAERRFKLRVRSYSADPAAPVFLEIKHRVGNVILKSRTAVQVESLDSCLNPHDNAPPGDLQGGDPDVLQEFRIRALGLAASPSQLIRYSREAYNSAFGDPVRITFDRDLVHQEARGSNHRGDPRQWTSMDSRDVVLELKFTEAFPFWVGDLIRRFDLRRIGYGKYVKAVQSSRFPHADRLSDAVAVR